MSRFLRTNTTLTSKSGETSVILEVNADSDLVQLFIPARNEVGRSSLKTLREEIALGNITTDSPETVKGTIQGITNSIAAFQLFQFNWAVASKVKAMVKQGLSQQKAIRSLLGTSIELATGEFWPMCSERQAYRILASAGQGNAALIPAFEQRGNRKSRYDEHIIEVTLQLLKNLYAVSRSKISLSKLTDLVNHTIYIENPTKSAPKVSRKYVRSILIKHLSPDLDTKRLDPRIAKSLKAVAANRIRPGAPLNRVEMDAVHLPFLIQTEYGVADNLWLLLAIDCETGLPLSWWLMLTNPTTEDTFQCLERAIYPKAELLRSMGIQFDIDPYGAMLNLIWDNGAENSRQRMARVAEVGINPQWAPKDSGNYKPFVERLNRSLKTALEALPGCTRFDGKDGKRTELAKKDKLMTKTELEHWIVRFLFEKVPHQPLERFNTEDYEIDGTLGLTPAKRWRTYEASTLLPLPPPREDWRKLRYVKVQRALNNKTGISLFDYDFKGDNLKILIAQCGPSAKVPVYYNPFDYRSVYVPDKITDDWLRLQNAEVTEKTAAFSFDDARKQRKARALGHSPHPVAQQFDNDMNQAIIDAPGATKNRTARRKEAHAITRADQAVQRAYDNPLPLPSEASLPVDSYLAEDAIPSFATHHKPARAKK